MIEKFLVQSCSADAFKKACLKYHCKFDSLWLHDVCPVPILVEDKDAAIRDCRRWNNEKSPSIYFCQKISVY